MFRLAATVMAILAAISGFSYGLTLYLARVLMRFYWSLE